MKIELEVSGDNEATAFPWWFIVDPAQNLKLDIATAAGQITGPFFSREEAEAQLRATRYNYSKRAVVWCASAYHTHRYRSAIEAADQEHAFR